MSDQEDIISYKTYTEELMMFLSGVLNFTVLLLPR